LILYPCGGTHAGNTSSKVHDVTETEPEYNNLIEFSVETIPTGLVAVGVAQLFCGLSNLPGDRPLRDTVAEFNGVRERERERDLFAMMQWTNDEFKVAVEMKRTSDLIANLLFGYISPN